MTSKSTRRMEGFASYAPLKFVVLYLSFTFILAVYGPVKYYNLPVEKVVIFMISTIVCITFGYYYGVASGVRRAASVRPGSARFVRNLLNLSLGISLAGLAISVVSAFISGQLNTDFSNLGDVYLTGYEGYERNSGNYSLSFVLYSLTLPFNFIALILGFFNFFSLSRSKKLLVIFLAVGGLIFYVVGSGKQKQLGDIIIYLLAVAFLKYGVKRKPIQIKWIVGGAAFSFVALMGFISILGQRYSALGVDIGNINNKVLDRIYVDTSHPLFSIFGLDYGLSISIFSSYLSQGYYGLGLALETDWQWTHFMGFSYSISILANRLLGLEWEWPNTLLHQVGLTTGWGETKWHTVFTHFATDFTFPGTVIIFGFFAVVYARSWVSATRYENPFSILMFSLLTMGVFFMPANNQLLHSPGALFTTVLVTVLYIWIGPRYNLTPVTARDTCRRRTSPKRQP